MKLQTKPALRIILEKLALSFGISVNHVRVLLALERIVARIEKHPVLSEHLIFKGGFALLKTIQASRYTRDVDALALGVGKEKVPGYVREALLVDLQDGFWFGDIQESDLGIDGDYGGIRFDCAFYIGGPLPVSVKTQRLSRLHLDIGFSDKIQHVEKQLMPTWILSQEPISWLVYPLENIFAEKLETLCQRGSANSRAKDVYDLVKLFPLCNDQKSLSQAILMTFENRKTPIPRSFHEQANSLQPLILKAAWSSIQSSDKPLFEEAWTMLLNFLKDLDKSF
ncbi:MAG: nucleotidyl transferase AbiEii/AbiGii toxin family protein [Myxococcaceae bacterium]